MTDIKGITHLVEELSKRHCSKKTILEVLSLLPGSDKYKYEKIVNKHKRKNPFQKGRHKSILDASIKVDILYDLAFNLNNDGLSLFTIDYLAAKYDTTSEQIINFLLYEDINHHGCVKICDFNDTCQNKIIIYCKNKRSSFRICRFNIELKRISGM